MVRPLRGFLVPMIVRTSSKAKPARMTRPPIDAERVHAFVENLVGEYTLYRQRGRTRNDDGGMGITVTPSGYVYVTGQVTGELAHPSVGESDAFIARIR